MSETAVAGMCLVHGGLMWDNKRLCLTPEDVIRGGCVWGQMPPSRIFNRGCGPRCVGRCVKSGAEQPSGSRTLICEPPESHNSPPAPPPRPRG